MSGASISLREMSPPLSHVNSQSRSAATSWRRMMAPGAIWFLIVTSFAQFRVRHAAELWDGGGIDWQVKMHLAIWCLMGLLGFIFVVTGRADLRLLRQGPLFSYVLYVLLAMSTVVISDAPKLTVFRSGQLLLMVILVLSMREHLKDMPWFICFYVAINWVLSVAANLGLHGGMHWLLGQDDVFLIRAEHPFEPWRFATAYGHPSIISIVAAVAAIAFAARTHGRQWRTHGPILAWLILSVGITSSRTAIAGMLGGLAVVALGRRALLPLVLAAGTLMPMAFLLPQVREATDRYIKRGQSDDEFESLTGRNVIYAEAFRRIKESWPIGCGFQSGRYQLIDDEGGFVGITHSHNLMLESAVNMGLLGISAATLVVLSLACAAGIALLRTPRGEFGTASVGFEVAGMLVPLFAFCILDRGFASCCGPDMFVFAAVAAMAHYANLSDRGFALRDESNPRDTDAASDFRSRRSRDAVPLSYPS